MPPLTPGTYDTPGTYNPSTYETAVTYTESVDDEVRRRKGNSALHATRNGMQTKRILITVATVLNFLSQLNAWKIEKFLILK